MSNVIQLLEKLGQDAGANRSIEAMLGRTNVDENISREIMDALRIGDQTALVGLLGARTNVFCAVFPAKENDEDKEDKEERKDDDDKESPDDASEKGLAQNLQKVAIAS